MTIWYKQGVCGDLQPVARKGLGRVAKLCSNLFVTSIRDGNHMDGSLHFEGLAFDIKWGDLSMQEVREVLGDEWDVVAEADHIHCEYDPK